MALFKDFTDKKLTFLPGTQYRCLYLDDVKPRMLVFDKSVLRGDVMSLVGVVAQEDKAAAKALVEKKGKLRPASLVSDGKVHALTFRQPVKTDDVKSKLQKLNPTLGPKLKVTVEAPDEEPVENEAPKDGGEESPPQVLRSRTDDDLPSRSVEKPTLEERSSTDDKRQSKSPGEALTALEAVLEAWRKKHGDPPVPPETAEIGAKWQSDLGKIADLAKNLQALHKKDFSTKEAERARDLEDDARVLQSRVGLLQRKGAFNEVDVKPILAWSWCSANIKRGALLDVLKAVLVPYEAAIKGFHKAPSEKTLEAAKKAQGKLVEALAKVTEHYEKKGGDDLQKLNVAKLLLAAAKEQKTVLERLAGSLGELSPEACATKGREALRKTGPSQETLEAERDEAKKKAQEIYDTAVEDKRKLVENNIRLAGQKRDRALVEAGKLEDEEARNKAIASANASYEQFATIQNRSLEQLKIDERGIKEALEKKADATLTLRTFRWSDVGGALDAGLPLHKALKSVFPAYEKALKKLDEAPTAENHAAAWKALQAIEKAIDSGDEATRKQKKGEKDAARRTKLETESDYADTLGARLLEEKTRLEAVEMELPQGKLAKTLADTEDGRRTLDSWVEELGGKASSDEDKALVRTAMRARFDLKRLDGEMTTKALPKMYKYLTMVPETHVRENKKIERIVRNRKAVPDGFYNIDDDGTDGLISMDMPRTGNSGVMKALFGVILPHVEKPPGGWKNSGVKKSEAKIIFSHLTLHEVGHAMDEKLSFMDTRLGNAKYGGWKQESAASLRKIAGENLGFYKALDEVAIKKGADVKDAKHLANDEAKRKAFLDEYLGFLQRREDPAEKLAARAENFTVDFGALAKEKGAKFIVASRLNPGAMQQVQQWDEKAAKALVDGRVYQEAYEDTYWSYDASARARGIGGYQFRAPGEWFSEIYACYYGGRLKSDHPDYAWLNALVASK